MTDPVVHDQHLNQSFRQDVPKKPEPEMEGIKISWLKIVPKFTDIVGVQVTAENVETLARLQGWDVEDTFKGGMKMSCIRVPGMVGDVTAVPGDWILIADNNWDLITVCTARGFNRSYEVKTDE